MTYFLNLYTGTSGFKTPRDLAWI